MGLPLFDETDLGGAFFDMKFFEKRSPKKLLTERFAVGLLIVGFLLFLFGVVLFLVKSGSLGFDLPIDSEKFDHLGGFLSGVVGSILTAASAILFYVALNEQRKDNATNQEALKVQTDALRQQTLEFEAQVKELEETRKVVELQTKSIQTQQFENTFFKMLEFLSRVESNISFGARKGKEAFNYFSDDNVSRSAKETASHFEDVEMYVRVTTQILYFLDQSYFIKDQVGFYFDILQGAFSKNQRNLFFLITNHPEYFDKNLEDTIILLKKFNLDSVEIKESTYFPIGVRFV